MIKADIMKIKQKDRMVKTDIAITRYEYQGAWIDVVDLGDMFEAWMAEKESGESHYLFGIPKEQRHLKSGYQVIDYDDFMEILEGNLV